MKYSWIVLIILTIAACQPETSKREPFKPPIIKQSKIDLEPVFFQETGLGMIDPPFAGKSTFCDTLQLSFAVTSERAGNIEPADFISELTEGIIAEKDSFDYNIYYNNPDSIPEYRWIFMDSIRTDGLEVFADYSSTVLQIKWVMISFPEKHIPETYFPVYVVNQTPTSKILLGTGSNVYAIQEAFDGKTWRPIEAVQGDWCGMGRWGLKINSDEFVTFLMRKYTGDFKTKMRVRVKVGDMIYVSNPFIGSINRSQFYVGSRKNLIGKNPEFVNSLAGDLSSYYRWRIKADDLLTE
jgi:hypothetical protein